MSEALVFDDRAVSWAQLRSRARELARALSATGVEPGDLMAVHLPSASFAILFHAARELGIALLPLNQRATAIELAFQIENADARWLIDTAASPAEIDAPAGLGRLRAADDGTVERLTLPAGPAASGPGGGSTLLYTSGTTGRPKAAVISRAAFEFGANAAARLLGASEQDRWLACIPLFHVGGIAILVRCALSHATTIVHPRFDPEEVSRAIDRDGVTHVSLVANMLERVLAHRADAAAPEGLKLLLVGGGPVPEDLLRRARALRYPVAPTYGLTEAASQVATRPPSADQAEGLSPLPGLAIEVIGEDGRALPRGSDGEIRLRGGSLMEGYWRQPEASARALRGGWLHTGDLGRIDERGKLYVLDRRSDLILSGGENVYPAEVEAVLVKHPGVSEVGVAGRPDDRFGARPHAWFVGEASSAELRSFCEQHLARYKVPVSFARVGALPRGLSGKLLRAKLGVSPENPS